MKTTITLITAMLLLVMVGCTEQPPADARYPFKSAIIKREVEGVKKQIIYIDDYGAREAREESMQEDDGRYNYHVLNIRIPNSEMAFRIDLLEKTALLVTIEEYESNVPPIIIGTEDLEDCREDATDTVAGKLCKVYRTNSQEDHPIDERKEDALWVWNGILMKTIIPDEECHCIHGFSTESIELNVPVPQEKFEVPKGVKVKEWWRDLDE